MGKHAQAPGKAHVGSLSLEEQTGKVYSGLLEEERPEYEAGKRKLEIPQEPRTEEHETKSSPRSLSRLRRWGEKARQAGRREIRPFRRIHRFKIPKFVFFVDTFPRTQTGKVQKHKMREDSMRLLNL
ncbi:hypothetical protein IscW_ISCW016532 [Ixodes scapularis]|uniref:Uncharacterized protein n=1 Tax=Ixodes scapularis TaxID=6945 RepID=B7P5V8_IXOSC|nr:hypothetical protein IscW_ISCW016532 [Ixodes scapularis]|eukprot:XP_002408026.1 hypothetical protein IscW_ISCW016532 [Ixodes scapularis]